MDDRAYKAAEERERNKRKYLVLEMILNGQDTSGLAHDCQHIANNLNKLDLEDQQAMFEKWAIYAPKPISTRHAEMKLERLIPNGYRDAYTNRFGY